MAISVFDMFRLGIGPSSSHTVGPMRAAGLFVKSLQQQGLLGNVARVEVRLYGSLGATGRGHGSDRAVIAGLSGEQPETTGPEAIDRLERMAVETGQLVLSGTQQITFSPQRDLLFCSESLPFHANGMRISALDAQQASLFERVYYSVGGGFVVDESATGANRIVEDSTAL
ncbi:MAG TPA: L-serine ammonia-lyase, partial [Planctomycetaceae bacterium]|nr:L-serine ammonia-lyase [Planctomycetaceae bacterium]